MNVDDKFIAFVDILGFSDLVKEAEALGGDVAHLFELTKILGSSEDSEKFSKWGPTTCPGAPKLSKNLNFRVTQISDCVVVSAEISPAGIINLISYCFGIATNLMRKGHLCRGVVTRGNILHTPSQFMGTGYVEAYRGESKVSIFRADDAEIGTPFIQIADAVVAYVQASGDRCVTQMFSRSTISDGTYTAIWPFRALGNIPSAVIGLDFDPKKMKDSVQRSRRFRMANLKMFEDAEAKTTHDTARAKIAHYKRGLLEVIGRLNQKEDMLDEMIRSGRIPYGSIIQ
jgi:hypothetical protein